MSNYGAFSNNPQTEWETDPSNPDYYMTLLRDFWYEDPEGVRWNAPEGRHINGASIPRPLWSTVGSPYTDDYRNASIVHDVACDQATTPDERKAADKMFYYACLAGGCSKAQARVLYLGVRIGAWGSGQGSGVMSKLLKKTLLYRLPDAAKTLEESLVLDHYSRVVKEIEKLDPDSEFDALEALVDQELPVDQK